MHVAGFLAQTGPHLCWSPSKLVIVNAGERAPPFGQVREVVMQQNGQTLLANAIFWLCVALMPFSQQYTLPKRSLCRVEAKLSPIFVTSTVTAGIYDNRLRTCHHRES